MVFRELWLLTGRMPHTLCSSGTVKYVLVIMSSENSRVPEKKILYYLVPFISDFLSNHGLVSSFQDNLCIELFFCPPDVSSVLSYHFFFLSLRSFTQSPQGLHR